MLERVAAVVAAVAVVVMLVPPIVLVLVLVPELFALLSLRVTPFAGGKAIVPPDRAMVRVPAPVGLDVTRAVAVRRSVRAGWRGDHARFARSVGAGGEVGAGEDDDRVQQRRQRETCSDGSAAREPHRARCFHQNGTRTKAEITDPAPSSV